MMDEKPQLQPQNGSFHSNGGNRGSRPSSIYDNFKENGQSDDLNGTKNNSDDTKKIPADLTIDNEQDRSPTQEFLLKTTVPQNLAAVNLAGRHTPTRNSLRHSRMIVMSRTGTSKGYFSLYFLFCFSKLFLVRWEFQPNRLLFCLKVKRMYIFLSF